jgi:hypothetical protein
MGISGVCRKRLVGEGGTSSALCDSEKLIVQPRTLISLGIGRYTVVRHAILRVPINVAAFKTIQIIFLSPLGAESLLPPAKLPLAYLDRLVPN